MTKHFVVLDSIACFHLDEYETAKVAFTAGSILEPSNATYKKWIEKCDTAIAGKHRLLILNRQ